MAGITELDAINLALTAAGATVVTTVDNNQPDVLSIRSLLTATSRQIQRRGWWFNREIGIVLAPDAQGHVVVPANTLHVDSVDHREHFVLRGSKLYDRENHTQVIGESVEIDTIILLPFTDLPFSAQDAIQFKTAMRFVGGDDGDEQEWRRLKVEFEEAFAELKREHLRANNFTVRTNPMVARVMHRRTNRLTTRFGGARS